MGGFVCPDCEHPIASHDLWGWGHACGYRKNGVGPRCDCGMSLNDVVGRLMASAWDEGANAAVEPVNTGTRMTLRAVLPFPSNPYASYIGQSRGAW